ncbi:MAG: YqxA family protein [Bacteroidales bacterium]|nr:YqxA family protein [Bacteroidales bacterium]
MEVAGVIVGLQLSSCGIEKMYGVPETEYQQKAAVSENVGPSQPPTPHVDTETKKS